MNGNHIGWHKSHYIDQYYEDCKKLGMNYSQMRDSLTLVDYEQAAYGDWHLYRDSNGNYWSEYFSIGD